MLVQKKKDGKIHISSVGTYSVVTADHVRFDHLTTNVLTVRGARVIIENANIDKLVLQESAAVVIGNFDRAYSLESKDAYKDASLIVGKIKIELFE